MGRTSKSKDSRKHTRRYERNELAIRKAIFAQLGQNRGRLTMGQVARAAHLSRLTIYNHHKNINRAITGIEDSLLKEFVATLDEPGMIGRAITDANRRLFFIMMIFMARHKDIFCSVCADYNNQELLHRMAEELFLRLEIDWLPKGMPAPAIGSERADLYIRMVVETVSRWGCETSCNKDATGHCLRRLVRITEAAAQGRVG